MWTGSVLLSQLPTIFAAMMLNFCVRHGYRCVHHAFATRSSEHERSKLNSFLPFPLPWLSSRSISIIQLSMSPCLHPWPIYLLVLEGPSFRRMGSLILEGASRLDAFSVYPFRTWLPSCATGVTTGAPSVRPPRSSRTEGSSPQTSCAHDR